MRISDLLGITFTNLKAPMILITTYISLSLKPNCDFHIYLHTGSESCSDPHSGDSIVKDIGSPINSC